MGKLLETFTYPRNAIGRNSAESAQKALDVIARVEAGAMRTAPSDPSKFKDEPFNDMRALLGIVAGPPTEPLVTPIGQRFRSMTDKSPSGAWRWVLTRALWLYSVPNGTNIDANRAAIDLGVRFNFFDMVLRVVVHLSALPSPHNVLYFDEFLPLLGEDTLWGISSEDLHDRVLEERVRLGLSSPEAHDPLLGVLETRLGTGRDNMNTIFTKALSQTGLFQMVGRPTVGIKLDPGSYDSPVLARRLRFVLDQPRIFNFSE